MINVFYYQRQQQFQLKPKDLKFYKALLTDKVSFFFYTWKFFLFKTVFQRSKGIISWTDCRSRNKTCTANGWVDFKIIVAVIHSVKFERRYYGCTLLWLQEK